MKISITRIVGQARRWWPCVLLIPAWAQALDLTMTPELRLNGFGTVGVTSTQAPAGLGFFRDVSHADNHGGVQTRTDARLGLQANYEFNPQFEATTQLVLRARAPQARPLDSVEWAFLTYRPREDLTVRLGRTSPDLFLMTDYRNVGFAYLSARPNTDFYGALALDSINGADMAYVWNSGPARWRIKAFTGTGHLYSSETSSQPPAKLSFESALGASITHEVNGLTLRASLAGAHVVVQETPELAQTQALLAGLQGFPDPVPAQAALLHHRLALSPGRITFAELGLSYERGPWLVRAELGRISGALTWSNSTAAYARVGRRFGDVTLFGMVGRTEPDGRPVQAPDWSALEPYLTGASQVAEALAAAANAPIMRQHSVSVGLRWDFHPQMALKAQWDQYWVQPMGSGLWGAAVDQKVRPQVGTLALDFVF